MIRNSICWIQVWNQFIKRFTFLGLLQLKGQSCFRLSQNIQILVLFWQVMSVNWILEELLSKKVKDSFSRKKLWRLDPMSMCYQLILAKCMQPTKGHWQADEISSINMPRHTEESRVPHKEQRFLAENTLNMLKVWKKTCQVPVISLDQAQLPETSVTHKQNLTCIRVTWASLQGSLEWLFLRKTILHQLTTIYKRRRTLLLRLRGTERGRSLEAELEW